MQTIQPTSPSNNHRLRAFDVAKGAALLGIIFFHYTPSYDPRFYWINKTFNFLPVFLLLSGYFISDRLSNSDLIKKRFKDLIIPYFIAGSFLAIASGLVMLFYRASYSSIFADVKILFQKLLLASDRIEETEHVIWNFCSLDYHSPLYFLPLLFVASLCTILSRRRALIAVAFFLLSLISYFTYPYITLPFTLQSGTFCFLFVYAGYLMKKTRFLEQRAKWYVILICALFSYILYIHGNRVDLRALKVGGPIIGVVGVLASSYLFILVCRIVNKIRGLGAILGFIGTHTLLLLAIHSILVMILPKVFFQPFLNIVFTFVGKNSHQIVCTVITRAFFDVLVLLLILAVMRLLKKRAKYHEASHDSKENAFR